MAPARDNADCLKLRINVTGIGHIQLTYAVQAGPALIRPQTARLLRRLIRRETP